MVPRSFKRCVRRACIRTMERKPFRMFMVAAIVWHVLKGTTVNADTVIST